jgi:tetratricopeptide (TPR) repeat protein
MRPLLLVLALFVFVSSCASSGPVTQPSDREWNLISADYQWLETLRKAQPVPSATATRKQQIELALDNLNKIQPPYNAFMVKLQEYYERTSDPRAAALFAHEKIEMGDEYMNVLARYDRALDFYRAALQYDPGNVEASARIAAAEARRFVSMTSFAAVKSGMKEDDVRKLVGLPREDWIKQVVQNNRAFSVWIYPKQDGGASAIYFDNGVVYHTNWNAAPAAASAASAAPAHGAN